MRLLEPKEYNLDGKDYILSKFPAVDGREIISKYPLSSIPKIGDYESNKLTMFKLMSFVSVKKMSGDNQPVEIRLANEGLINNHVPSWETLMKLEKAMLEYNCSFLTEGLISTLFGDLVQNFPLWISKMLTGLLAGLSEQEKQPSTSSKQSIP